MGKWKRLVRTHLHLPELGGLRGERIVEEIAGQFEDLYDEARRHGASRAEAERLALQHVGDWGELASRLADAERGNEVAAFDRWYDSAVVGCSASGIGAGTLPAATLPIHRKWAAIPGGIVRNLLLDVVHAGRLLAKDRGFTLMATLTLAIGIGLNVAIFSVVNGMLLRPLPYPNQQRLVWIDERTSAAPNGMSVAFANFVDWRERQRSFDAIAAFFRNEYSISGTSEAESVPGLSATGDFFRVLGTPAAVGRTFGPADDRPGASPVVVIGHSLWQRRFGGGPIAGQEILVNGAPRTIIGVMPPGFAFPNIEEIWVPTARNPDAGERAGHSCWAIGTLKPSVSLAQARADMSAIAGQLAREYPETNARIDALVVPIREKLLEPEIRLGFLVFMGAVGFVLLIACANVANLLLARGVGRGGEMALRVALGASHWRIVRLLLVESLLLSGLGAGAGLLLGRIVRDVMAATVPEKLPTWMNFDLDIRVCLFAAVLAVGTALIFGLVPALRSSRPNLQNDLRAAGARSMTRSGSRLRSLLVAVQVSLAFLLLAGGALMTRSIFNLIRRDNGFRPENVLTLRIAIPRTVYRDDDAVRNFYSQLLDRLRALPGVERAGAARVLPTSGAAWVPQIIPEGAAASSPEGAFVANQIIASPGYFETMGIRVLRGRGFSEQEDRPDSPGVVVVNEAFVRRHWPTGDPIGRRLKHRIGPDESPWLTVIGVVGDVQYRDSSPSAATYLPYQQRPSRTMCLALKTGSDPLSLAQPVRQAVGQADPNVPCVDVQTMQQILSTSLWQPRLLSWLLGLFGSVALVLTTVGVYGMLSYAVSRRAHDIGIRIAMGADPGRIRRTVLLGGLVPVCGGMIAGLAGAFALGGILQSLLYRVNHADPLILAATVLFLGSVAAFACNGPARRASRMDPVVTLRSE